MSTPDESTVWRLWRESQEENARLRQRLDQAAGNADQWQEVAHSIDRVLKELDEANATILMLQHGVAARSSQLSRIRGVLNRQQDNRLRTALSEIREIVEER